MPLQNHKTGCYRNKSCRRYSDRQEMIFNNQRSKDNLPVVNNFAIQKGSVLLTRKFALIPDVQKTLDKKRTYSVMTDMFVKITSLKNVYIQKLIEHAKSGDLNDFKGSSKVHARRVYDALSLTKFDGLPFLKSGNKQFKLKERVKQCANFEVYIIVRNWLIRNENLKVILDYLISKFENDEEFALTFLAGKRFSSKQIHEIQNALEKNCFGQRQNLSTFYLNNYIYQIRNLFFKVFNFSSSLLYTPQNKLQRLISEILINMNNSPSFIKYIANSFTRKKNRKVISVSEDNLFQYLLNLYIRNCKSLTTRLAQRIITLRKEKYKLTKNKSIERFDKSIRATERRLFTIITPFHFKTKKQFLRERNDQIDDIKAQFLQEINTFTSDDLYHLVKEIFLDECERHFHAGNQYVLRSLFKPKFNPIKISEISINSLMKYMAVKVRYKIRDHFKQFFMTNTIKPMFQTGFTYLQDNLESLVSNPEVKAFSLNLIMPATFREEYENHKFKLGFIANKFIPFRIKDDKNRLKKYMGKEFKPANPTITFKHRKLLLNLPFEAKKGSLKSFQENSQNSSNLEMGVDLNLAKHPAVVSVWDKGSNREIARYFLSWRSLIDRERELGNNSNMKLKLRNLRQQIKILQRKKNNYEQRLLQRGIANFRSKLKWNKIKRELSLCWNRLNNINSHIVGLVNHFTIHIANLHNISKVRVEDLRFSKHSKKRDSGKFMAFWQTHWFFSQVQDAIKLQCQLNGIKFQKVPARGTSQRCSRCGKLGDREGKVFHCNNCGLTLDSDLNAARNVVIYEPSINQTVEYQVHFNDPIW